MKQNKLYFKSNSLYYDISKFGMSRKYFNKNYKSKIINHSRFGDVDNAVNSILNLSVYAVTDIHRLCKISNYFLYTYSQDIVSVRYSHRRKFYFLVKVVNKHYICSSVLIYANEVNSYAFYNYNTMPHKEAQRIVKKMFLTKNVKFRLELLDIL